MIHLIWVTFVGTIDSIYHNSPKIQVQIPLAPTFFHWISSKIHYFDRNNVELLI